MGRSDVKESGKRPTSPNDSDDDIWEYGKRMKPAVMKRKNTKGKGKQTKNSKQQPTMPSQSIRDCFSSPSKCQGHCPFCQMPFRCLPSISSRTHAMECMDIPIISVEECADGVECQSNNPAHYRKYRHSILAGIRAGHVNPEICSEPDKSGSFAAFAPLPSEPASPDRHKGISDQITEEKCEIVELVVEADSEMVQPSTSSEISNTDHIDTAMLSEISEFFTDDTTEFPNVTTCQNNPRETQLLSDDDIGLRSEQQIKKKIYVKDSNQTTLLSFFGSKNITRASVKPKPRTSAAPGEGPGKWTARQKKQCPFYKKIPGTPFTVDAFNYGTIPGCTAYFLSHFHSDHYGGLTKKFQHQIYCYKVTGNLVERKLSIASKFIHKLEMNKLYVIEGVEVTLLDANHCPGSVLFLFRLTDGRYILHTGDFRANVAMESYPSLRGIRISQLYLDTTYCNANFSFPPQSEVIEFAVKLSEDFKRHQPNGLIVIGSYSIGKERIFMAIAKALSCKVCVTRDKQVIMECLDDVNVQSLLTREQSAGVHVLPMNHLRYDRLEEYLLKLKPRFDSILALQPTGWSHSDKTASLDSIRPKCSHGNITIYGVPYSEHSSFKELKRFVQFVQPEKILPTVNNGNAENRRKMEKIFHDWLNEEQNSPSKRLKQTGLNSWIAS